MAKNADGTVTVKTPGKVAQTPSGSGTGKVTPVAAKGNPRPAPKVVPVAGRGPVAKTSTGK